MMSKVLLMIKLLSQQTISVAIITSTAYSTFWPLQKKSKITLKFFFSSAKIMSPYCLSPYLLPLTLLVHILNVLVEAVPVKKPATLRAWHLHT